MYSPGSLSIVILILGVLAIQAATKDADEDFDGKENYEWITQYMPETFIQFTRAVVVQQKAHYELTKPLKEFLDTVFRSIPEAWQQVQGGLVDYGNRRSGNGDPIANTDENWEETKCLYEEYGPGMMFAIEQIKEKYWSKDRRCGDP